MIRGMDISSYPEMVDRGIKYYDASGNEVDMLEYAVKRGFNYARLRIWKNPDCIPETEGYCSLEKTIAMAKMIVSKGIGFLLDFHYSDWWADPGNQRKPKEWENFTVDQLEEAVYQYTKECMEALDAAGAYPDMVQIGNEIRTGMLFPEGAVPNWHNLARFVNAGIRAVRETQGERRTKIMLHLDQGGKYEYFREWFDCMQENGVRDYDIIGLSYYPFWHGTFYEFKQNMDALVERYGKELVVAETAHPFRKSGGNFFREEQERAAGFPAERQMQKKVLELIMNIIANVKEQKGLGFFYWEPFVRTEEDSQGWGTCMGLMDENGRPTPGFDAIAYEPDLRAKKEIVKIYYEEEYIVRNFRKGMSDDENLLLETDELPTAVKVLFSDGSVEEKPVSWQIEKTESGEETVFFQGTVLEVEEKWARQKLLAKTEGKVTNLLPNGDFADGLTGYQVSGSVERVEYGTDEQGFWYKATENFFLDVQVPYCVTEAGNYRVAVFYRGGNTTGTNVELYVKSVEEKKCSIFPESGSWKRYSLDVRMKKGEAMLIGVRIDAPPVSGRIREIRIEKIV